jgi:hypothetical protein
LSRLGVYGARVALIATLGLGAATPALAGRAPQTEPPASATAPSDQATTLSSVIVTARPPPKNRAERERAMDHFVRDHAGVTHIDRYVRWREPLCLAVLDAPPGFGPFMTARIARIATAVGLKIDPDPKCLANVEVVFSVYPQQLINRIHERHPLLVGYHYASAEKALLKDDHPVKAWYVTATVGEGMGDDVTLQSVAAGQAVIDTTWTYAQNPSGGLGSHIDDTLLSEFLNVMVIIDQAKVAGQPIGAVTDYVVMLALSQPAQGETCGVIPSILDLFTPNCHTDDPPKGLTYGDAGYLKGLYSADLRLSRGMAESQILETMRRSPGF